jgi:hypothetical protein
MKLQAEKSGKKQYATPQLLIYGNVLELTQNITNAGTMGDNPTMKT